MPRHEPANACATRCHSPWRFGALIMALLLPSIPLHAQGTLTRIGNPGNAADTNGLGSVARPYRIALHELTNADYVQFLNAVAATDTHDLFDFDIMTDTDRGGILRSGSPGSFTYATKTDFGDKPVNGTDWLDAARYCNWLHNGTPTGLQAPGTTEDGAYDLSVAAADVVRAPGATFFLPSHDEWYKAAYHDPFDAGADAGGTPDYWVYPTRSDSFPTQASSDSQGNVTNPGPNVANYEKGADWNGENGNVTTVGSAQATSAWGLFDLGGNVNEWTDTLAVPIDPDTPTRFGRGGDFSNTGLIMGNSTVFALDLNMAASAGNVGFRVARYEGFADLGAALAGTHGEPLLEGDSTLAADAPLTLSLSNALESTTAFFVFGITAANAAFKGGTLVPDPNAPGFFIPLPTGLSGSIEIADTWPPGVPSGFDTYYQYWIQDPAGQSGFAASNALQGTTP